MYIWKVKMATNPSRKSITNIYHIQADTLRKALDHAEKFEEDWAKDISEDEGEKIEMAEVVSVEFICEIDV